jgi:malonyl-CoA/methylmalonyl-CoA synthetase
MVIEFQDLSESFYLRIVNNEGRIVEGQTIGSIQIRGDNVFQRYWGLPDKTNQAFDVDGWFDTGDQGSMNSNGYLFISGRSKDIIITGGLNVYPKEVERELEDLSGILEAAVFGVPHHDFGEGVMAAVVMLGGNELEESSIVELLNGKLAKFKIPKHIVVLDKLPRNAMGKVIKSDLRDRYASFFRNS